MPRHCHCTGYAAGLPGARVITRAKRLAIEAAIDQRAVIPGKELQAGFGVAIDERIVEYPWLFGHLSALGKGMLRVLDAGSILNHDFILKRAPFKGQ